MLSIKQLQAFIHVAQSQNFAQAALKMHISQPALSSAIKKCEDILGGELFARTTRTVELTKEGRLFLPKALRLYQDYIDLINDTQAVFDKQQGTLHIACIPSFAEAGLIDVLAPFIQQYPTIKIKIEDVVVENVIDSVLHERAEIGIIFAPTTSDELDFYPLFNDEFMLVMAPQHPLANVPFNSLQQLSNLAFVTMNQHANLRVFIDDILADAGITVDYVAEASQIATLANFVKANMGLAILPTLSKTHLLQQGLVCKSIHYPGLQRSLGMIRKKEANISVTAQAFWDMVKGFDRIKN